MFITSLILDFIAIFVYSLLVAIKQYIKQKLDTMYRWNPGNNLEGKTLGDVLKTMHEANTEPDTQENIPWSVRAVENPNHWLYKLLRLPGGSALDRHDALHAVLETDTSIEGEAFVLGFSMGSDTKAKPWHFRFYVWWVTHVTPQPFVFTPEAVKAFKNGTHAAKATGATNVHLFPLETMHERKIGEIRRELGINLERLKELT